MSVVRVAPLPWWWGHPLDPELMARAKIWLGEVEHLDNWTRWAKLIVGQDLVVGVAHLGDGQLHVAEMWSGAHTTVRCRLVGIEWHEMTDDGPGRALRVNSAEDDVSDSAS